MLESAAHLDVVIRVTARLAIDETFVGLKSRCTSPA
jgi:hypothetical protein